MRDRPPAPKSETVPDHGKRQVLPRLGKQPLRVQAVSVSGKSPAFGCPRGDLNPHDRYRSLAPQASASAYSATRTSGAVHIGWLRLANLRHCWRTVHRGPRGALRDLANPERRWMQAPEVRGRSGVLAMWHPRPSAFWPGGPRGRIRSGLVAHKARSVLVLWHTRPLLLALWHSGTERFRSWVPQGQNLAAYERPRPVM